MWPLLALTLAAPAVAPCSPEQIAEWEALRRDSLGIDATDPEAQNLFSDPRDPWPAATDGVHEWPPFRPTKVRLCGTLHHYGVFCPRRGPLGVFGIEECDLTANVIPGPAYADLIAEAKEHFPNAVADPCGEKECIHCEITTHRSLPRMVGDWERWLGPRDQSDRPSEQRTAVCLYGPPVVDTGHDFHPELHPIQILWARQPDERSFALFVLEDASARFNGRTQFVHAHRPPDTWRAWAEPPVRADFRVAYRSSPGSRPRFRIRELYQRNVVSRDVLPGTAPPPHLEAPLVPGPSGEEPAASVTVERSAAERLRGVEFTPVCARETEGVVQGYLVFRTAVGKAACDQEGYHMLLLEEEGAESGVTAGAAPRSRATRAGVPLRLASMAGPVWPVGVAETSAEPLQLLVAVAQEVPREVTSVADPAVARAVRSALLRAAQAPVAAAGADIPVRRVRQWELTVRPHYGGSELADKVQEDLSNNRTGKLAKLLGLPEDFAISARWEDFRAFNPDGTPASVPVRDQTMTASRGERPRSGEILIERLKDTGTESGITVTFADDLSAPLKLTFRMTLTDTRHSTSLEHSLWTHGIAGNAPAKALIGALDPKVVDALSGSDLHAVEANDILNSVGRLGRDGLLTAGELESLMARIRRLH
jgi:hypothetical protein